MLSRVTQIPYQIRVWELSHLLRSLIYVISELIFYPLPLIESFRHLSNRDQGALTHLRR